MATYAIGDIQGCWASFAALLKRLAFDPKRDRVWLVGDLVNRGPRSLEVLRYIKALGSAAVAVLGNHDLHLIARYHGLVGPKRLDTLEAILGAPDAPQIIEWLASRPLMHHENGWTMVHAGLPPRWTVQEALAHARRLEAALRDPTRRQRIIGADGFSPELRILTTIRTCRDDGSLCRFNGAPEDAPAGCVPWFLHPRRRSKGERIVFGHWAALGLRQGQDYLSLDTGCVWGGSLTAVCLEDFSRTSVPTQDHAPDNAAALSAD